METQEEKNFARSPSRIVSWENVKPKEKSYQSCNVLIQSPKKKRRRIKKLPSVSSVFFQPSARVCDMKMSHNLWSVCYDKQLNSFDFISIYFYCFSCFSICLSITARHSRIKLFVISAVIFLRHSFSLSLSLSPSLAYSRSLSLLERQDLSLQGQQN